VHNTRRISPASSRLSSEYFEHLERPAAVPQFHAVEREYVPDVVGRDSFSALNVPPKQPFARVVRRSPPLA